MEGPVQWAVLSFLGGLAIGGAVAGWTARGFFSTYDTKIVEIKSALAALSNAIQDRNHLLKYDYANVTLRNDLEHLRNNFKQHQAAAGEMHDDFIRLQSEVERLGKIVNGKH